MGKRKKPGLRIGIADMEARNAGYLLRDTHRTFRRIMRARIAPFGVTVAMWAPLWELWREDGLTQSEIARRIKLEKPSANSVIKTLVARGLAERRTTERDRRERRVFLTAQGSEMRGRMIAMAARINDDVLRLLDEAEAREFMRLLRKVNAVALKVSDESSGALSDD
jgi:DNA-binding MarR family transcriptional regulator